MRKLTVFNSVSLDGFFTDSKGDMSWAKDDGTATDYNEFVAGNASSGSFLLFGRVTYDMMAGFWPTPAAKDHPIAAAMNSATKVVFSRKLKEATWNNTTLVKEGLGAAVARLKSEEGPNMTVLGSGKIVAQLTQAGLVDEFQLVTVPIILGQGRTLFDGVTRRVALKLVRSRSFSNGHLVSSYILK